MNSKLTYHYCTELVKELNGFTRDTYHLKLKGAFKTPHLICNGRTIAVGWRNVKNKLEWNYSIALEEAMFS